MVTVTPGLAGSTDPEGGCREGSGQKQLQQLLLVRIAQLAQRNKVFDGLCSAGRAEAECRAVDPSCQVHGKHVG